MFDNKKCPHKIYKQGNNVLCLTSLYKKEQDEQIWTLREIKVREKIKAFK